MKAALIIKKYQSGQPARGKMGKISEESVAHLRSSAERNSRKSSKYAGFGCALRKSSVAVRCHSVPIRLIRSHNGKQDHLSAGKSTNKAAQTSNIRKIYRRPPPLTTTKCSALFISCANILFGKLA